MPADIHPLHLGKVDGTKVNHHQMIPYPSEDLRDLPDVYLNIKTLFAPVLEYISAQVSGVLILYSLC